MTFSDYVTQLRIQRAKELLSDESMSVGEIAEIVGYNDYFYFIKVFKKFREYHRANTENRCRNSMVTDANFQSYEAWAIRMIQNAQKVERIFLQIFFAFLINM